MSYTPTGRTFRYELAGQIPTSREDLHELYEADAVCVSCSDFRITSRIAQFMDLENEYNYDQLILPGASIGVNMNRIWQDTTLSQMGVLIELHAIKDIYIADHESCGAAKLEYGDENYAQNWKIIHADNLLRAKKLFNEHFPGLKVWMYLMHLDGSIYELVQD